LRVVCFASTPQVRKIWINFDAKFIGVINTTKPWYYRFAHGKVLDVMIMENDTLNPPNLETWNVCQPSETILYFRDEYQNCLKDVFVSGPVELDCEAILCASFNVEAANGADVKIHSNRSHLFMSIYNRSKLGVYGNIDNFKIGQLDRESSLFFDCHHKKVRLFGDVLYARDYIVFDVYK
jgi:hypothetical protein